MSIHAIIFDFGNVIGFFDHRLVTKRLAEHSPLPADVLHATLFGSPLEQDYDAGRLTTAEFLQLARDAGQLRCSEEVFTTAWVDIFWPNDELIALLPLWAAQQRLLLGSNTNELHSRHFRQQFADALRHFDYLVFSHDARARKPEPAFFEHCVRLAGCQPQECVFIDDLPANVAGAEACGLYGIVFQSVDQLCARLAALGVATTKD